MSNGTSSTQAKILRRNTTSKGCRPAFIAMRENTASPANRAMAIVIQMTPVTGSLAAPAAGGLSFSLKSGIDRIASPMRRGSVFDGHPHPTRQLVCRYVFDAGLNRGRIALPSRRRRKPRRARSPALPTDRIRRRG